MWILELLTKLDLLAHKPIKKKKENIKRQFKLNLSLLLLLISGLSPFPHQFVINDRQANEGLHTYIAKNRV